MAAYYNEIDPHCAAWLRNLIGAGHIAAGLPNSVDVLRAIGNAIVPQVAANFIKATCGN